MARGFAREGARQRGDERRAGAARRALQLFQGQHPPIDVVARQDLVRSLARQDHGDVLAGDPGNEVERDAGRIGHGLVQMPHQIGNEVAEVGGAQPVFVVLGSEARGCQARVAQLVGVLFPGLGSLVSDTEGLDSVLARDLAHDREDAARIQPPAEKQAERDFRDQTKADAFFEQAGEFVDGRLWPSGKRLLVVDIPVFSDPDCAVFHYQDMPGLELVDLLEPRARPRDIAQREIEVERFRIERARHAGHLKQRLDLGGEDEEVLVAVVVERLDAQPVASQEEPPLAPVPDGEGEHPAQPFDARLAELLVGVNDRLGIGARPKTVAARREIAREVGEVVDLAVEHDHARLVLVVNGLLPAGQVDDAQPPMPEADAPFEEEALVVRPPVGEGSGHPHQHRAIHRFTGIQIRDPANPAHAVFPLCLRARSPFRSGRSGRRRARSGRCCRRPKKCPP